MTASIEAHTKNEKPEPLVIEVGHQGDGSVYELRSDSMGRIIQQYPQAAAASSLFIGTYRTEDQERIQNSRWREIGKLLTGLSDEQIDHLGGLLIFDPVSGQPLWSSGCP